MAWLVLRERRKAHARNGESQKSSKSVLELAHLRRTGTLALVVGTWLTLFNQGGAIWAGELGSGLWIKLALNYLTPFIVANLGLLSKTPKNHERKRPDSTD